MEQKTEYWLSPMNRVLWIKAFRAKANSVTLRDGRQFKIRYHTQKIFGENKKVALVIPAYEAFAPMGYFDLAKVTDKLWIEESTGTDSSRESIYAKYLNQFMESGYKGVQAASEWPELEGKSKETLRQGFKKAINEKGKDASHISVMVVEGKVYIFKGKAENGS